jgi:hypothetical protein
MSSHSLHSSFSTAVHYNTVHGTKLTHVLSGCFQSFQCIQECCCMLSIWPSQLLIWRLTHTPEHCHLLDTPQTSLQEAVKTEPIILFIFILSFTALSSLLTWSFEKNYISKSSSWFSGCYQSPGTCYELHCTRYHQRHLCSFLVQSPVYHAYSLPNQLLSIMALDCMDDSQI